MKPISATAAQARGREALWRAWLHVQGKAKKSTSAETRGEAHKFSVHEARNLERIGRQLREGKFRFAPAKGILIAKPGKSAKRPVVVAPVESRIVQRALLDIVQAQPPIKAALTAGFNFGGVEGSDFGVPSAVLKAQKTALLKPYYIRTDIKSFFTKVPREAALNKIFEVVTDEGIRRLLKEATDTELADISRFGDQISLFPIHEEGVAQGSCLSPLLCNLLLSDFDVAMNCRGIVCIRYIDDFILFAGTKKKAFAALKSARHHLKKLGLDVYDPDSEDEAERRKADHGPVKLGFDFLGCTIRDNTVRPTAKNRDRLRENVRRIFDECLGSMADPLSAALTRSTYADAIRAASLVIRGWGNTHSFCNDTQIMQAEDGNLGLIFEEFSKNVKKRIARRNKLDRRRLLGLFLLQDCNVDASHH